MSRPSKTATIIVVDVGKSMATRLDVAMAEDSAAAASSTSRLSSAKPAALLTLKRLLRQGGRSDEVGVVLCGTEDSVSWENDDDGSCQHVRTLSELDFASLDLFKKCEELDAEDFDADLADALTVACGMLDRRTRKKAYSRKVLLVTDAGGIVESVRLKAVATSLEELGVDVEVALVGSSEGAVALRGTAASHGWRCLVLDAALAELRKMPKRRVRMTPKFKGVLEITPKVQMRVEVWARVVSAKVPSLKSVSQVSLDSEIMNGTGKVKIERTYYSAGGENEVPPEERHKGQLYGGQIVTWDDADEAKSKYECDKGISVLGFAPRTEIPRHRFIESPSVVVGATGCHQSQQALSALVQALLRSERVAIARFVSGNARTTSVKLCALIPYVHEDRKSASGAAKESAAAGSAKGPGVKSAEGAVECLYLVQLPFAEDVRCYDFPSIDNKEFGPSDGQIHAAEKLVEALTMPSSSTRYAPESTPNPYLHRCPPSAEIVSILEPDRELFERATSSVKEFASLCSITRTVQGSGVGAAGSKRSFWGDDADDESGVVTKHSKSAESTASTQRLSRDADVPNKEDGVNAIQCVGAVDPIGDFNAMLQRVDDLTVVDRAISGMGTQIKALSLMDGDAIEQKALDAIVAMREGCARHQENGTFNIFLRELRVSCSGSLWSRIVAADAGLIVGAGGATREEAQIFLSDSNKAAVASGPTGGARSEVEGNGDDEDDDDDYLDLE